jgi:hypothetical protein
MSHETKSRVPIGPALLCRLDARSLALRRITQCAPLSANECSRAKEVARIGVERAALRLFLGAAPFVCKGAEFSRVDACHFRRFRPRETKPHAAFASWPLPHERVASKFCAYKRCARRLGRTGGPLFPEVTANGVEPTVRSLAFRGKFIIWMASINFFRPRL